MKLIVILTLCLSHGSVYFIDRNPNHPKPCEKVVGTEALTLYVYQRKDEKIVRRTLENNMPVVLEYRYQVIYYQIKLKLSQWLFNFKRIYLKEIQ